jgi:hypothetical protein
MPFQLNEILTWLIGLLLLLWFVLRLMQVSIVRNWIIVPKASQRAYIQVTCEKPSGVTIGSKPTVMIVLKNSGRAPAFRVRHRSQIGFAEYPLPKGFKVPDLIPSGSPELTISPGVEYRDPLVANAVLTQQQLNEIAAHSGKMFVRGTVRYHTLGVWHYTNFAFFWLDTQYVKAPVGNESD